MSIIYCEKHSLRWDSDKLGECPECENEHPEETEGTQRIADEIERLTADLAASRQEIEGLREYTASRDADVQSLHDKFMHEYDRAETAEQQLASLKAAEQEIDKILQGIDSDECGELEGWWETSTGAEFGAEKLNEIKLFVRNLIVALVPGDGMVVVPEEPTPDMCDFGGSVELNGIRVKKPVKENRFCVGMEEAKKIYKAMLKASKK